MARIAITDVAYTFIGNAPLRAVPIGGAAYLAQAASLPSKGAAATLCYESDWFDAPSGLPVYAMALPGAIPSMIDVQPITRHNGASSAPSDPALRAPTPGDDSTLGYTTASVWQYPAGQFWQPQSVAAGNAVWTKVNIGPGLPVDILGAACAAAGGTIAIKANYTGPAIDISVTIGGTATSATINILANGELDAAAASALANRADANTVVTVTKLYDQTGNGNHFAQQGATAYPCLTFDDVLGRWAITHDFFNGGAGFIRRALQSVTAFPTTGNNSALFAYGRTVTMSLGGQPAIGSNGIFPGTYTQLGLTPGSFLVWSTATSALAAVNPMPAADMSPGIIGFVMSAAGTQIFNNETVQTMGPLTAQAQAGAFIGTFNAGSSDFLPMRLVGIAWANAAPSAAQVTALKLGAYAKLDRKPQIRSKAHYIGDSRFQGLLTANANNIPTQCRTNARVSHNAINYGVGGQTAAYMLANTIPGAVRNAQINASAKNVFVILAGVNDFIVNASTPAQTLAILQSCVALAKTAPNARVILLAELSASGANGTFLSSLNALIVAAGAPGMGCDEIIDLYGYTPVTSGANTAYYGDGLHPTAALASLIGQIVQPRVDYWLSN